MTTRLSTIAIILFSLLTVSVASGQTPDEAELLAHLETMATVITENRDDCDEMAASLDRWWRENSADLAALTRTLQDQPAEGPSETYLNRMDQITNRIVIGTMECADNEQVAAVFETISKEIGERGPGSAEGNATRERKPGPAQEEIVRMFEELGEIAATNQDNCDQMGIELRHWIDERWSRFKEVEDKLDSEPKDEPPPKELQARTKVAIDTFVSGAMKCLENDKVADALNRLAK